jgi:hypothetical protein
MDIDKIYKESIKDYVVTNDSTGEKYKRYNTTSACVRHWIINHLDISQNWTTTEIK